MEQVWHDAALELCVPRDVADAWWRRISEQYSERGRVYHTKDKYLERKIATYERLVKDNISERAAFVVAMFFQHFEYETNVYGDSFDKNVAHLKEFFKEAGIDDECLKTTIVGLLGAACDAGFGKEGLEAYFQDLELAALGAAPEDYNQYIVDVEQEYSNMAAHMYRSVRLKVLQTLLLIPRIYSTDIFHDKFESQARENIQREINEVLTINVD